MRAAAGYIPLAEPVGLPAHDGIEASLSGVGQHPLELGSLLGPDPAHLLVAGGDGQPIALAVDFHLAYLLGDGGLVLPVLPEIAALTAKYVDLEGYDASMVTAFLCRTTRVSMDRVRSRGDLWAVYASDRSKENRQQIPVTKPKRAINSVRIKQRPRWEIVSEAIREMSKPAHFSEVAEHMRKRNKTRREALSEQVVRTNLVNHTPERFRRVGSGIYGLAEWGLPDARNSTELATRILEFELRWLIFQEIWVRMKNQGWQYLEYSVQIALDIECDKPRRRIRRTAIAGIQKYGLSRWTAE